MGDKKVTWAEWVKRFGWAGKTYEERIQIFQKLKPAWQEKCLQLMEMELDVRVAAHQPSIRLLTSEEARARSTIAREEWAREGIYFQPVDSPSKRDRKTQFHRVKGDSPPMPNAPIALMLMGEKGRRQWENDEWYKWRTGPLSPEDLDMGEKKRRAGERRWKKYWDEWDRHPTSLSPKERNAKVHQLLAEALRTAERNPESTPDVLFEVEQPGQRVKFDGTIFEEDVEKEEREHQAAKAREEQRDREFPQQFGGDGGKKKAANAEKKASLREKAKIARNRPRMDALAQFRENHPDCTLPEARDHLAKKLALAFPSPSAAESWLRDRVKDGMTDPFVPTLRGRRLGAGKGKAKRKL
jgi:hypothetical protein